MKVTEITHEKEFLDNGLDSIVISNLGKLVVLSGKNGAGKSRLLHQIEKSLLNLESKRKDLMQAKRRLDVSKDTTRGGTVTGAFSVPINQLEVSQNEKNLKEIENELENKYNYKVQFGDAEEKKIRIYNLFPNGDEICLDPMDESIHSMRTAFHDAKTMQNINDIYKNHKLILFYLHSEVLKIKSGEYNNTDNDFVLECYREINVYLQRFLGSNYKVLNDKIVMFDNQTIENLSLGQKLLLRYAVLLVFYKKEMEESIFIVDEPETHLHPKVVVELLCELKELVGQLWIATHNVSILAYFQDENFIYIEDSILRTDGRIKTDVLSELVGRDSDLLANFIEKPFFQGFLDYNFECLFQPLAIPVKKNDPQILQISHYLKPYFASQESEMPISMLDYGAGECNFFRYLVADFPNEVIINSIDYYGFDISDRNKVRCDELLSSVYGNDKSRYLLNLDEIDIKVDVVLLSNLLHEINPKEWGEKLKYIGDQLLNEKGVLLLLENTEIKKGENAHEYGFIVLNTDGLNLLFDTKSTDDELICLSDKMKGQTDIEDHILDRVQAHIIKKKYLDNITNESIKRSLLQTKENACEQIKRIRLAGEKNRINGKRLAFFTQQYTSASIAYDEL
ncbi:MAG: AAA family ATPase [Eubacteriales bacterium]